MRGKSARGLGRGVCVETREGGHLKANEGSELMGESLYSKEGKGVYRQEREVNIFTRNGSRFHEKVYKGSKSTTKGQRSV